MRIPALHGLNLERAVGGAIVIFFGLAFLSNIQSVYWSDSEMWAIRQGSACWYAWNQYACSWKPMFNGILSLFHTRSPIESMRYARFMMIPIWLAVFWFGYRRLSPAVLICYLGSSLFFLDAAVSRSDFWALPFLLLHLDSLFDDPSVPRTLTSLGFLRILAPALLAILITPKALIPLLCLTPVYWSLFRRGAWIVGALLLLGLLGNWREVSTYFFRLFTYAEYGMPYWSWARFKYVERGILENPHLLLLTMLLLAANWRKLWTPWFLSACLVLGSILFYPDKLPFWISAEFLIFLFVVARTGVPTGYFRSTIRALAAFAVVNGLYWYVQATQMSNGRQAQLIEALTANLAKSYPRIYDGLGLAPVERVSPIFLGPGQDADNQRNLQRIRDEKFDIIILVNRLNINRYALEENLNRNYLEASPDLFVRAEEILIKDPAHPGPSLRKILQEDFARNLNGQIAIVVFNDETHAQELFNERTYSIDEIATLPALCEKCQQVRVRVTPFGNFMTTSGLPSFRQEFSFEPRRQRRPIWAWF